MIERERSKALLMICNLKIRDIIYIIIILPVIPYSQGHF